MPIKIALMSKFAARWRQRVKYLCEYLARTKGYTGKKTEIHDGWILQASKAGKNISGNIVDTPQVVVLLGQNPPGIPGPLAVVPHQYVTVGNREWFYRELRGPVDSEVKGRMVSYALDTAAAAFPEGRLWSVGNVVTAGKAVVIPELRSHNGDDGRFFDLPRGVSLSIEAKVIYGGVGVYSHAGTGEEPNPVPEPKRSTARGVGFDNNDLESVAPGFKFLRYYRSIAAFVQPLSAGHDNPPQVWPVEVSDTLTDILVVAPTFKESFPPGASPITTPSCAGITGIFFGRLQIARAQDELEPTVVLLDHFSMLDHPTDFMVPNESLVSLSNQTPFIDYTGAQPKALWDNRLLGLACAGYEGGVAVLSVLVHTGAEFDTSGGDLTPPVGAWNYASSTLVSRNEGSSLTHESVFENSNDPTVGFDRVLVGAYTSGTVAVFHVLRLRVSDVVGPPAWDPDQWTNIPAFLCDIHELVTYTVSSSTVDEQVTDLSTLGLAPMVIEGLLNDTIPTAYYDNHGSVNTFGDGLDNLQRMYNSPTWWFGGGAARVAQLDDYRVLLPMIPLAVSTTWPYAPADLTITALEYDTRSGDFTVASNLGAYQYAVFSVVNKATLDDNSGEEVVPATVLASVIHVDTDLSETLISFDSGRTWETAIPELAPFAGAFFVGNGMYRPDLGDPWPEFNTPEE